MWFSPLLIGLSLGILGGGGSILVVPILTYLFKIDPKTAIAYSLLIVGLTSLFGVIQNLKNIEYKKIILFSLLAFFGTFIGTKIAFLISSQIQMILFSLIMLITSYKMFMNKKSENNKITSWKLPFQGFLVGLLSGIIGVGGGFLIVPALINSDIPIKRAIPTSLLIITFNSISGTFGYLEKIQFDFKFIGIFVFISIVGFLISNFIKDKLDENKIKKLFSLSLLIIAMFVIIKNIS